MRINFKSFKILVDNDHTMNNDLDLIFTKKYVQLTLICTRKSLKCSLKAGISWLRLTMPWTVILIWFSERWGKAALSRLATNPWTKVTLFVLGAVGLAESRLTVMRFCSTSVNMYARMDACIVRPAKKGCCKCDGPQYNPLFYMTPETTGQQQLYGKYRTLARTAYRSQQNVNKLQEQLLL